MTVADRLRNWLFGRWEYVGRFEGHVTNEDGLDPNVCYFILTQKGGQRRAEKVDGLGAKSSRHSVWAKAQVESWLAGGPLPEGMDEMSPEPAVRPKAQLIVFPGGKDPA